VTDAQIENLLASSGVLPSTDANNIFVVYVPSGITVEASGEYSGQQFCAYHSWYYPAHSAVAVNYVVMPYVSNYSGCNYTSPTSSAFDNMTPILSHEIAETVTDPTGAGYFLVNQSGVFENGDICAFNPSPSGHIASPTTAYSYALQYIYSYQSMNCRFGSSSVPAPNGFNLGTFDYQASRTYQPDTLVMNPSVYTIQLSSTQATNSACATSPSGFVAGTFASGAGSTADAISTMFATAYSTWWNADYFTPLGQTFTPGSYVGCKTINAASVLNPAPAPAPAPPPSSLNVGGALGVGNVLVSPNGAYFSVFQGDGNFVTYTSSNQAVWASGTGGRGGAFIVLQGDGNLVIYSGGGQPLWASNSGGQPVTSLSLGNDGVLSLSGSLGTYWTSASGALPPPVPAAPPSSAGLLSTNGVLTEGHALVSSNGYQAVLQGDGNFVIYSPQGRPLWADGMNNFFGPNFIVVQGDGNMVDYLWNGFPLWSTRSSAQNPYLVIQGDGNLVLYSGSRPLWATGT